MSEIVDPGFAGSCFVCGAAHGAAEPHAPKPAVSRRGFVSLAATAGAATAALAAARGALAQTQPPAPPAPPRGPFALQADWTLAMRGGRMELLRGATVIVRGNAIEEVRDGAPPADMTRIAMPGQVLLPGFISGHTHVCSATPTRGIIEGGRSFARPLELVETLADDEMDALTAFNLAELLRSGCTTQVEMALSLRQAQSYVRVAKAWGVRGFAGGMIPGIARLFPIWFRREEKTLADSVPGTIKEIADNIAFGREIAATGRGLVMPMMSPHATDTHTPETMAAILAGAREFGTGLHIHLSQSARETERVKAAWGATPTQWLEKLGFFALPVFAAHMTGAETATDFEIMKKHGGVYSHCPSAGGSGGSGGLQPYPEALTAGVATNIGIDTHSNDYLENLKLAVLIGRTRARILQAVAGARNLRLPTIWDAVEAATVKAANGLRRADLGRIEAGAKADLVSIEVSGLIVGSGATPPEPLNHLLYANGTAVKHVLTDGAFQVRDGRLAVADEAQVIARGGAVAQAIWAKLRAENWFTPTPR
jgi:cytosine/adenosine deaminase-related metal-dependent hydrolase